MKYLFSPSGNRFLEKICKRGTLFAFDYDGTLAPLISNSAGARISKIVRKNLEILKKLSPVAIISGRALDDLAQLLDHFHPQYLIGNHGSEGISIPGFSMQSSRKICKRWFRVLSLMPVKGVEIENKNLTLSIHYRHSPSQKKAKDQLLKIVEKLEPVPHVILGKSVINLLPHHAPNKGSAIMQLSKSMGCPLIFYLGDDKTDEDVFALDMPKICSVRVGKSHKSQAEYFIKRQSEINKLLTKIIKMKK